MDDAFTPSPKVAIVTPSYWGDLQQCTMLVESLRKVGADFDHYLIVDRYDAPLFRELEGSRTHLIESESIIDPWLRRMPGRNGYWLSLRTLPVRGWIMQQIRKIAVTRVLPHDTFIMCDSDVAFIRPLELAHIFKGHRTVLLDNGFQGGSNPLWTKVACALLGIEPVIAVRNHVGMMICWQRTHLLGMQQRIETVTGKPWQLAIARELRFSEYMLYGAYIRSVVGYEHSGHAPIEEPPIKTSWNHALPDEVSLNRFFDAIAEDEIGVMLHSKDRIDPALIRSQLERRWELL